MAVAVKESVSCPYPDEKTRRFPESRRRRNPFCRRRADSKIESGCCGRKERIYSSRGAQAGNGGIYLAAPAVEYTVFSKEGKAAGTDGPIYGGQALYTPL